MVTTVFSPSTAVAGDDTNTGTTFRVICTLATSSNGSLQITILPGTSGVLDIKHVSFGKWSGTGANTTATPIEALFAGASGFTGATTAQTSDLTSHSGLTLSAGDKVVVIFDIDSAGSAFAHTGFSTGNSNAETWFHGAAASYNLATVSGYTQLTGTDYGVSKVETNASGGSTQTVTGTLYAGTDTTPGGVVGRGAVTLSGTLFSGTDAFHAATVSAGAVSVSGALYAETDTFPAASISVGAVTVAGSIFAETNTFGAGTVALPGAPQTITGTLFANDNAFPAGSVAERQQKHAGGWDDGGTRRASGPRRVVFIYDPPQEEKKAEPVKRVKRKITRRVVQEAVAELPKAEAATLPPVSVLASLLPEFVSIPQANPAADAALLMHVVRMLAMQAAAQAAADDEQDIELLLLAAA